MANIVRPGSGIACGAGQGTFLFTLAAHYWLVGTVVLTGVARSLVGNVLGESKYGPNSGPQWKAEGSRYPNLYKVLLQEPLRLRKRELLENNSQVKKPGGQNTRRLVCAWIRKQ